MTLALQHHKVVKIWYKKFIGYYHKVLELKFSQLQNEKKKTQKTKKYAFDVFVTTCVFAKLKIVLLIGSFLK